MALSRWLVAHEVAAIGDRVREKLRIGGDAIFDALPVGEMVFEGFGREAGRYVVDFELGA